MIKEAIVKIVDKQDLTYDEAYTVMNEIMSGGTPAENAIITRAILDGTDRGHKRNAVLINAGMALCIGDIAANINEGVKLAAELIDSGAALKKMEAFVEASRS